MARHRIFVDKDKRSQELAESSQHFVGRLPLTTSAILELANTMKTAEWLDELEPSLNNVFDAFRKEWNQDENRKKVYDVITRAFSFDNELKKPPFVISRMAPLFNNLNQSLSATDHLLNLIDQSQNIEEKTYLASFLYLISIEGVFKKSLVAVCYISSQARAIEADIGQLLHLPIKGRREKTEHLQKG